MLQTGCSAAAAIMLAGCASPSGPPALAGGSGVGEEKENEQVTPGEDLMREHGALGRILLIYQVCQRRLQGGQNLPEGLLAGQAMLIRRFVEDYHERNEEQYVFPVLEKAAQAELVRTLLAQHQAGRVMTDHILASAQVGCQGPARQQAIDAIGQFLAMYFPHMFREDTIAFPAFQKALPLEQYRRLGEALEDREQQVLGKEGFEHAVEQVAAAEKTLGIYELAQFTPR
jgi:hemerythrin-like domain-containing protein